MFKKLISFLLLIAFATTPLTYAQTDTQKQIQELLKIVAALQEQLNELLKKEAAKSQNQETNSNEIVITEPGTIVSMGELSPTKTSLSNYKFNSHLNYGSRGRDVFELQKLLNKDTRTQVAYSGWGRPGKESNYFGNATKTALKKFQKLNGLSQTGYLDQATRALINTGKKEAESSFERHARDVVKKHKNPLEDTEDFLAAYTDKKIGSGVKIEDAYSFEVDILVRTIHDSGKIMVTASTRIHKVKDLKGTELKVFRGLKEGAKRFLVEYVKGSNKYKEIEIEVLKVYENSRDGEKASEEEAQYDKKTDEVFSMIFGYMPKVIQNGESYKENNSFSKACKHKDFDGIDDFEILAVKCNDSASSFAIEFGAKTDDGKKAYTCIDSYGNRGESHKSIGSSSKCDEGVVKNLRDSL